MMKKNLPFALSSRNQSDNMRPFKIRFPLLMLCFVFVVYCCGCGLKSEKPVQGVIVYDVTFPYLKDKILLNVFPEEMIVSYKGDQTHGMLKSLGGIVASEFIANEKERSFCQLLKAFQDRYVMELSENEVKQFVSSLPAMTFEPTNETDSVAGFLCKKTIANFQLDSVPPVVLYHTTEIQLKNPNWYSQYQEIDGVLLGYEVEQYGMRMKLTAKSVEIAEVKDELFEVSPKYQRINSQEMKQVIDSLIGNFGTQSTFD